MFGIVDGRVVGHGDARCKPLEGAQVSFKPEATSKGKDSFQRPSHGTTDATGKFTLGTYGKGDGIPSGKYKVRIRKRELVGQLPENYNSENPDATPVQYKWVTPRSYSDPESSGLLLEVTSSALKPNLFDLKTNGAQPEVETTGPQAKFNEP